MNKLIFFYLILSLSIFVSDRISKFYASNFFKNEYIINKFLSFQTVLNPGVSCGLFNGCNNFVIIILTIIIISVIIWLIYYSYTRFKEEYKIFGEICVITGAISNLIDRFIYGGVVDFIEFHYKQWYFPSFNIADSTIVLGVFFMFIELYKNDQAK